MHNNLLSIWNKHRDSIVFGILFQTSLSLMNLHFDPLKTWQVDFVQNFFLYFLKILLFKFDLFRYWLNFLIKVIYFIFINCKILNLVPQDSTLVAEDDLLLWKLSSIFHLVLLSNFCAINGLLNSLIEIHYLIIHKVLVYFHFFFEISHFSFVYEL